MRGGGRALPVQRRGLRCCMYKAHGQPYLLAGTERFDFMGYYMVAAMWGTVCVLLAVCLVLFIRRCRRAGT